MELPELETVLHTITAPKKVLNEMEKKATGSKTNAQEKSQKR